MELRTTQRSIVSSSRRLALRLLLAALVAATAMFAAGTAHAATIFTVNDAGDFFDRNLGDGLCDFSTAPGNQCSLRAAIQEANHPSNPGPDTIEFEIGGSGASGVKTIRPVAELPQITETVTIDGFSQPGAVSNTLEQGTNAALKVQLDGSSAGAFSDGLSLGSGASNSIVKGVVINRFDGQGIEIFEATGTEVEGNFIGTDVSGTLDLGNNLHGVLLNGDADSNTIGGTLRFQRNLISGNGEGVNLNFDASRNEVQGNLIGTKKDGTSPLGNDFLGVAVRGADNFIGDFSAGDANTIAFNGQDGVLVGFGTGNRILSNSIFSNGGLGIDLEGGTENDQDATQNDPGDADTGSNDLQNRPTITSAATAFGVTTTVQARLNSTPNRSFMIELFSNPSAADEGEKIVDEATVRTDANGNATFMLTPSQTVPAGRTVTATATDLTEGNTSEFSAPRTVVVADTTAPTVTRVVPEEDATGVAAGANVSAFFSEVVRAGSVNANTVTLRKAGTTGFLAAAVSYDAAAKRAILDPSANLQPGATYVATVTSGVRDVAGNPLDGDAGLAGNQPKTWKFTVRR